MFFNKNKNVEENLENLADDMEYSDNTNTEDIQNSENTQIVPYNSDDDIIDEEYDESLEEEIVIDPHMSVADIVAMIGFIICAIGVFLPLKNGGDISYFTKNDMFFAIIIPVSLIGIILSLIRVHRISIVPAIVNMGVIFFYIHLLGCGVEKAFSLDYVYCYRIYTVLGGMFVVILSYLFIGKAKLRTLVKYDILWISVVIAIVAIATGYVINLDDYNTVIVGTKDK